MDSNTFQRIFCLLRFQKAKETENTSADYHAKKNYLFNGFQN